ncbi:MAG: DUF366 family protein [Pseudobdellovibrionaceae bacterium]
MKIKFVRKSFPYTGQELRHLFAYEKFGIAGESMISWIGPCDIALNDMIDGEDKFENSIIRGGEMLHFVGEFFEPNIFFAVSLQRLFCAICLEQLTIMKPDLLGKLVREGDDLYVGKNKLSISIATIGHFSTMIHFAVNVTNEKTPVPTCALKDFRINPEKFALNVLKKFQTEYKSIVFATQKVQGI